MFLLRAFGGLLYLSGAVIMTINVWKTIAGSPLRAEDGLNGAPYDAAKDRPMVPAAVPAE
jgi:cytochrome c oxidase cbb3-type subunit 1